MLRGLRIALLGSLLVAAVSFPALAQADDVVVRGHGSAGTPWRLELARDGGQIDVDFKILSKVASERWRIVMKDEGHVFWRGVRTTGSDGHLEVTKKVPNHNGTDRIVVTAKNQTTAETIRAVASIT